MLTQLFGAILHAYRNATQLNSKWYKVRRCSDELLLYLLAPLVQKYKY